MNQNIGEAPSTHYSSNTHFSNNQEDMYQGGAPNGGSMLNSIGG
jgi:hypothetical protein